MALVTLPPKSSRCSGSGKLARCMTGNVRSRACVGRRRAMRASHPIGGATDKPCAASCGAGLTRSAPRLLRAGRRRPPLVARTSCAPRAGVLVRAGAAAHAATTASCTRADVSTRAARRNPNATTDDRARRERAREERAREREPSRRRGHDRREPGAELGAVRRSVHPAPIRREPVFVDLTARAGHAPAECTRVEEEPAECDRRDQSARDHPDDEQPRSGESERAAEQRGRRASTRRCARSRSPHTTGFEPAPRAD